MPRSGDQTSADEYREQPGSAISFSAIADGDGFVFRGVIETDGFTSFELVDSKGTAGDQVRVFADDFTMAVPEPKTGHLLALALAGLLLLPGNRSVFQGKRDTTKPRLQMRCRSLSGAPAS